MRKRSEGDGITVHAMAGTRVVIFGIDVDRHVTKGLLGFTIYKREGNSGRESALLNGKCFKSAAGSKNNTRSDVAPIQAFMWGDYSVEPGKSYTYRIVTKYGKPGRLKAGVEVTVAVKTESPDEGVHGIYFNRGVAGSQAFSRRFGKYLRTYLFEHQGEKKPRALVKPEIVPDREAYKWLSRGLEEAMLEFIAQAKDDSYSLRAAVYEFTYLPAVQAFVDALERGVDVKIVHHAKQDGTFAFKMKRDPQDGTKKWRVETTTTWESGSPPAKTFKNRYLDRVSSDDEVCTAARATVSQAGLKNDKHIERLSEMLIDRTITEISHNKFIVLLKNGKPVQVFSGSTNFTAGGIFGQYNVGHVIRDPKIAQKYLAYWKKLSGDPPKTEMTKWNSTKTPDIESLPSKNSVTPIFSPRPKADTTILDWYAERFAAAKNSVFLTAAFSVDERFLQHFDVVQPVDDGDAFQRYLLIETRSGLMREKYKRIAAVKQNRVAWGDVYKTRPSNDNGSDDAETAQSAHLIESLTGLNTHVEYLHTKYMLIDPLSDDPLVVTGSANFSENSTTENDENMLVIRGDTRVADIFLSEFMRLFNHFSNRNRSNRLSGAQFTKTQHLSTDDSWTKLYFKKGSPEEQQRLLFR